MKSGLLLENELEPIFLGKFPPFPENVKEFMVRYGPYFLLVSAVFTLFALLAAFGIGTAAVAFGTIYRGVFNMYLGLTLATIIMVMYLMAFSPLRARKRAGWNLLYYALLINLASSLLQFALFSFIVGGIIGFWVLFQIRDKYIF